MMHRSRARRVTTVTILRAGAPVVAALVVFAACGSQEREDVPRFYYPPDVDEPLPDVVVVPPGDTGAPIVDGGAVDADADAGPIVARALASGAADHLDPLVGHGDHTCVIAGPTRALYCWGANDHGQIGNGKTGAGAFTEDVAAATKIAVDETGLAFDGLEEISLSAFHSCARKGDVLFCWGQRYSGAQAEPPAVNPDRTAPRAIGNFDVKRIAAGGPHTCALQANGKVACFGHSAFNELGRANADDPVCAAPFFQDYNGSAAHQCAGTLVEVMFGLLPGTASVAAGETHSCALAAGKVHCWGAAAAGQLGRPLVGAAELNAQVVSVEATGVMPLEKVTAIASDGAGHTCAVHATPTTAGLVSCWGRNDVGQLGVDAVASPTRAFAAPVTGLSGVTSIGVADHVTCAVRADSTVACWGNDLAALGDGGVAASPTPAVVKGPGGVAMLTGVAAVAPGTRHACALKTDGTVWCWGRNDRGQLGDGTKADSAYPVKVTGLP